MRWTLETESLPLEDRRLDSCPLSQILETPYIYSFINSFHDYKYGILPNEGAFLDQPLKFRDIVNCLSHEIAWKEEKMMNKQKDKK